MANNYVRVMIFNLQFHCKPESRQPKVKGIIYLQPITATRAKPEEDFYKLQLDNVPAILITTFWTKERNEIHESRMEELEASWKRKDIRGPAPRRYDSTPDAAWDIVTALLTENKIDWKAEK